jgi:hypothetical protein
MDSSFNLYIYMHQHNRIFLNNLPRGSLAEKLQDSNVFMHLLKEIDISLIHDFITNLSDEYMIKSYRNLLNLKAKMKECELSLERQKEVLSHPVCVKLEKLNPGFTTKLVCFIKHDWKEAIIEALNYEGMDRLIKRC